MSTITILQDNVTVLTIEGTIVGHAQAGSSAPVGPTQEPGGDYSTNLEAPGGHGHKFRPGQTEFTILGVEQNSKLEFAIVGQGDSHAKLTGPGGVLAEWTIRGIDTVWSGNLQAGDYTLLLDAPSYGEINHQRHPYPA